MILVRSCMIVDAICYLDRGIKHTIANMPQAQIDVINELNKINYQYLNQDKFLSCTSSIMDIISEYYHDVDLSTLTLVDLITFFKNIYEVKDTLTEKFSSKYVFDSRKEIIENLIQGEAQSWIKNLEAIMNNNFEEYWQKKMLPSVTQNIQLKEKFIKQNNLNQILENIKKLRKENHSDNLYIYVSYLTTPLCFQIKHGFVDQVLGVYLTPLIAHECMHGFASPELISLYQRYVNQNEFLKENHRKLTEDWGSGDEEELVMSAEYYLLYLHGWSKDKIITIAKNKYHGCCLLALELFSLAIQEKEMISDYNNWCITQFKNGLRVIDENYVISKFPFELDPRYFGKWYSSDLNERLEILSFDGMIKAQFSFGDHQTVYKLDNLYLDEGKLIIEMNDEYYLRVYQLCLDDKRLSATIKQSGQTIISQFEQTNY